MQRFIARCMKESSWALRSQCSHSFEHAHHRCDADTSADKCYRRIFFSIKDEFSSRRADFNAIADIQFVVEIDGYTAIRIVVRIAFHGNAELIFPCSLRKAVLGVEQILFTRNGHADRDVLAWLINRNIFSISWLQIERSDVFTFFLFADNSELFKEAPAVF